MSTYSYTDMLDATLLGSHDVRFRAPYWMKFPKVGQGHYRKYHDIDIRIFDAYHHLKEAGMADEQLCAQLGPLMRSNPNIELFRILHTPKPKRWRVVPLTNINADDITSQAAEVVTHLRIPSRKAHHANPHHHPVQQGAHHPHQPDR